MDVSLAARGVGRGVEPTAGGKGVLTRGATAADLLAGRGRLSAASGIGTTVLRSRRFARHILFGTGVIRHIQEHDRRTRTCLQYL